MKLAIEIARTTADGKVLRKSFEVGKKIAKPDFERLFSENEQENFRRMDEFSLNSSFNEGAMKVRLYSKTSGTLLNGELLNEAGSIFLIHKYNTLRTSGQEFRCQLIVCGTTRRSNFEK